VPEQKHLILPNNLNSPRIFAEFLLLNHMFSLYCFVNHCFSFLSTAVVSL
jgi:hypothetical protein